MMEILSILVLICERRKAEHVVLMCEIAKLSRIMLFSSDGKAMQVYVDISG